MGEEDGGMKGVALRAGGGCTQTGEGVFALGAFDDQLGIASDHYGTKEEPANDEPESPKESSRKRQIHEKSTTNSHDHEFLPITCSELR